MLCECERAQPGIGVGILHRTHDFLYAISSSVLIDASMAVVFHEATDIFHAG